MWGKNHNALNDDDEEEEEWRLTSIKSIFGYLFACALALTPKHTQCQIRWLDVQNRISTSRFTDTHTVSSVAWNKNENEMKEKKNCFEEKLHNNKPFAIRIM